MDKKKTGNLIRDARTKKGYTQQELGDMVGVTNKAISRWENGESFPDVSLLDTLSYTLDLDINEIVLGEKKDDSERDVALEMAQIARMENNKKARLFKTQCVVAVVYGLLAIVGIRTIVYGLYGWPVQVLYYGCALCVFVASYINVKRKNTKPCIEGTRNKIVAIISGLSVIYSIILVCGTLTLIINGINILELQDRQIGPFINYQLLFICFINIISALFFTVETVVKENDIGVGLHLQIAGVFLSMVYSDLLHRLVSPQDFVLIFILDTAVILGIVAVGTVLSLIVGKLKCKLPKTDDFPS